MSVDGTTVPPTSVEPEYYDDPVIFVVRGVALIAIGAVGVLGNALTVAVLSQTEMRSSINCLLLGLAASDTVLIITYVLLFGFTAVCHYTNRFCYDNYIWPHVFPYVSPIAFAAQSMSVYLTLVVSAERWVAVCYPFRAKTLCTVSRARWCVLATAVLTLLYNAPRFLEASVLESKSETGEVIYVTTIDLEFMTETYVMVYEHWICLVVMFIVPLTALVVLNACIVRQLRRERAERALLSRVQRQDLGVTRMLLVVVLVFCLCNLLPLAVNSIRVIIYYEPELNLNINMENLFKWFRLLLAAAKLFVTTYSSVNFFIYIIFGANFKRVFLKTFCVKSVLGVACVRSPNKKAVNKAQGTDITTKYGRVEKQSAVTKL